MTSKTANSGGMRETQARSSSLDNNSISYLEKMLSQPLDTRKITGDKIESIGVQFLITEYDSLADLWKHTDARFESGVNIYLTASALVVSAIVFFSQSITDTNLFLGITAFAAVVLAVTGIVLSERLLNTSLNKAEYIYARDLIRRFFSDNSPDIIPYLYFFRDSILKEDVKATELRPPRNILLIIQLWSSFLVWLALSIVLWLIVPSLSINIIVSFSLVVAIVLFTYLNINTRRKVENFRLR